MDVLLMFASERMLGGREQPIASFLVAPLAAMTRDQKPVTEDDDKGNNRQQFCRRAGRLR